MLAFQTGDGRDRDQAMKWYDRGQFANAYPVKHFGLNMIVPRDDAVGPAMRMGAYEPFEIAHMVRYLQRGDVVVDVGANIGMYAMIAAAKVSSEGLVLAFEPAQLCIDMLRLNIESNGMSGFVKAHQKCLGAECGTLTMRMSPSNAGDNRTWNGNESATWDKIQADVVTLDSLNIPKIDFLKLDTQGTEFDVLKGGLRTIKAQKNMVIMLEYWPSGMLKAGSDHKELLDFLCDDIGVAMYGFSPSVVEHPPTGGMLVDFSAGYNFVAVDKACLLDLVKINSDFFLNLWCVKGSSRVASLDGRGMAWQAR